MYLHVANKAAFVPSTGYADASSAIPKDTIAVMAAATGIDQIVPAVEASFKLMPIEDPTPDQLQVNVKETLIRLYIENC